MIRAVGVAISALCLLATAVVAQISGPIFPGPGLTTAAPVPVVTLSGNAATSLATLTLPTTATIAVGELIVLTVHQRNNSTVTGVTDAAGNTWSLAIAALNTSGSSTEIWYSFVTNQLNSGSNISIPVSGGAGFGIYGSTVRIQNVTALDKTGSSTSTLSSATGTLTTANQAIVGAATDYGSNPTWTQGAGFTNVGQCSGSGTCAVNNWGAISGYQIVSATTTVTYAPTETGGGGVETSAIASFK